MTGIERLIGLFLGVVDKVVPDTAQAAKLKAEIATALLTNGGEMERLKADIIGAEAKSESWITRNWRPIAMINFLFLLNLVWFGAAPDYLAQSPDLMARLFDLLTIGIAGYGVGRSGEKIAERIGAALEKR